MRAWLAVTLLFFCVEAISQEAGDHKPVTKKQESTQQKEQATKQDHAPVDKTKSDPVKDASNAAAANPDAKLQIDREIAEYTRQLAVYTKELSKYTGDVSSFTLWLVIATVVLGAIGAGQGYLAWRSVKVAESALTDLERPYVFIDVKDAGFHEGAVHMTSGRISLNRSQTKYPIAYRFINHGKTAGVLIALLHRFYVTDLDGMPDPIDRLAESAKKLPEGIAVGGESHAEFILDLLPFLPDDEALSDVLQKKRALFLIGFVRYKDVFKRSHLTGFCARFERDANRFFLKGDERYNYTKEE